MEKESKYFTSIATDLPDEERAARTRQQQHAEWGVAVSRLGGLNVTPDILQDLQRYINGQVSLAELIRLDHPPGQPTQVYRIVERREEFAG